MKKIRISYALLLIACAFSTGKLSAQDYKRKKAFYKQQIRTTIKDALFEHKTEPLFRAQEEAKRYAQEKKEARRLARQIATVKTIKEKVHAELHACHRARQHEQKTRERILFDAQLRTCIKASEDLVLHKSQKAARRRHNKNRHKQRPFRLRPESS